MVSCLSFPTDSSTKRKILPTSASRTTSSRDFNLTYLLENCRKVTNDNDWIKILKFLQYILVLSLLFQFKYLS